MTALIASLYMHVYDAVQDTIIMCYCWDKVSMARPRVIASSLERIEGLCIRPLLSDATTPVSDSVCFGFQLL